MSIEQCQQNFISLLPIPEGNLVKEEFVAFFDDLSVNFSHDEPFMKYVGHLWGYNGEKCKESSE